MNTEVGPAKQREYVYVGEAIPPLTEAANADFLLLMREAVIFSLEKRQVLTQAQRKRCVELLGQHRTIHG